MYLWNISVLQCVNAFKFPVLILKCSLKYCSVLMLLYFIESLSRNLVQVHILNKQMSHADSEHELKCVFNVYAFTCMHLNFVYLFLRIEWEYAFWTNKWIMQIFKIYTCIELNFEISCIILYTRILNILNDFVYTIYSNIKIKSS